MTEKKEPQRSGDGGGVKQGPAAPPRSYSDFMRALAAKYNGQNPAESHAQDLRDEGRNNTSSLPHGVPFAIPPFMIPHLNKDAPNSFPFLAGFHPQVPAAISQTFPPNIFPSGLLDPNHAQIILNMVRNQIPPHNAGNSPRHPPPLNLTSDMPPTKKKKKQSECSEDETPVSPPPGPPAPLHTCPSLCSIPPAGCSSESRILFSWNTDQVVEFVKSVPDCLEYVEIFKSHNIDGAVLALLTDTHLQSQLGLKLGPALKLRAAISAKMGTCQYCRHCKHCHQQSSSSD